MLVTASIKAEICGIPGELLAAKTDGSAPVVATPSTVSRIATPLELLTVISVPIMTNSEEIAASSVSKVSPEAKPTVTSPFPVTLTKLSSAAN